MIDYTLQVIQNILKERCFNESRKVAGIQQVAGRGRALEKGTTAPLIQDDRHIVIYTRGDTYAVVKMNEQIRCFGVSLMNILFFVHRISPDKLVQAGLEFMILLPKPEC